MPVHASTVARALTMLGVAAFIAAPSRTARADEIDACKSAAEEGDARRLESKLRAARERFLACSRLTCPAVIRDACIQSFSEVDRTLPTVVVRARDARGQDVLGVRVLVDGGPLLERLTGKATPVDPGPHLFRFEAATGDAREEQVLVAQGEHDRLLYVTFDKAIEPDGMRPRTALPVGPVRVDAPVAPGLSLLSIGLMTGLGLAGVGIFASLQLSGWADYRALRADGCGATRTCDGGGVRGKLIGGDIALGLGVASLGVAIGLTIARLRTASDAPRPAAFFMSPVLDWQPSSRASFAGLRGTF